ncbi:MAG: hypothetical protein ABIT05_05340 [Chitinophagaceae bacterium]
MINRILACFLLSSLVITMACSNNKEPKSRMDEKNIVSGRDVPEVVKASFLAKYPGATAVLWENATEDSISTLKVKFKRDGKFWKAEFNKDGSFIKDNEDYK